MARFRSIREGHYICPEATRRNGAGPIGDTRNQDIKTEVGHAYNKAYSLIPVGYES